MSWRSRKTTTISCESFGMELAVWSAHSGSVGMRPPGVRYSTRIWRLPGFFRALQMNLASTFHSYYNKHRVLVDDPLLRCGRLNLVLAVQKVIRNGLKLLGVSAPQKM